MELPGRSGASAAGRGASLKQPLDRAVFVAEIPDTNSTVLRVFFNKLRHGADRPADNHVSNGGPLHASLGGVISRFDGINRVQFQAVAFHDDQKGFRRIICPRNDVRAAVNKLCQKFPVDAFRIRADSVIVVECINFHGICSGQRGVDPSASTMCRPVDDGNRALSALHNLMKQPGVCVVDVRHGAAAH